MKKKQMIRGATKRKAGEILIDAVSKQLGATKGWIDDPWAKPYAEVIRERLGSVPFNQREYPL